jgi:hypothetical protein
MSVSATESYMDIAPQRTNILSFLQPNTRYFRRYLSCYLLTDKRELWGKNTTIYMKQANNLIRPCRGNLNVCFRYVYIATDNINLLL